MSKEVRVEIFGQSYTVVGELPAAYVQELANFVDEKMRAVSDMTSMVDTQRIAVLAALAIADELKMVRGEEADAREDLRERTERCLTMVERALGETD